MDASFDERLTAGTPRILWIELTSKCPFDCVFCSRKLVRGNGEHLELETFERVLAQLDYPEILRLNYSGESIHYPHLAEAVQAAKRTAAIVELVSAFSSATEQVIRSLVDEGLDRLSVSIHTMDEEQYRRIYGFSTLSALKAKLHRLRALQIDRNTLLPEVTFAFVAMDENLDQLPAVAAFASEMRVGEISIHPVIRRDPVFVEFASELNADGQLRPEFYQRIAETIDLAQAVQPNIRFSIARPAQNTPAREMNDCLTTCEQNPWETMHILANGDVVPCEVQDKRVLGSVATQTMQEVWHGEKYRTFRAAYREGASGCGDCPWRRAIHGNEWSASADATSANSPQFLRGWHPPDGENAVWSRRDSILVLGSSPGPSTLTIRGMLPASQNTGSSNSLTVSCGAGAVELVTNSSREIIPFDVTLRLAVADSGVVPIEFTTSNSFSPARENGGGKTRVTDTRKLGFALINATLSDHQPQPSGRSNSAESVEKLFARLERMDRLVSMVAGRLRRRTLPLPRTFRPGLTVLIPERGSVAMLSECLHSAGRALSAVQEPWEVIVIVNGSNCHEYSRLPSLFPWARLRFYERPLGFSSAINRGLACTRHDWVYLLNSDMILDEDALFHVLNLRASDVFSIGSQIFMRDTTARRVETNFTRMASRNSLVELLDAEPPKTAEPAKSFYCGGGSSLFQTRLLKKLIRRSAIYDPFYFEDAEWGAIARRHGYENLFCPASKAIHHRRATVAKYYEPGEVERIFHRNRLTFQLRNFPHPGFLQAVRRELASADAVTIREFVSGDRAASILLERCRSALYPESAEQIFADFTHFEAESTPFQM